MVLKGFGSSSDAALEFRAISNDSCNVIAYIRAHLPRNNYSGFTVLKFEGTPPVPHTAQSRAAAKCVKNCYNLSTKREACTACMCAYIIGVRTACMCAYIIGVYTACMCAYIIGVCCTCTSRAPLSISAQSVLNSSIESWPSPAQDCDVILDSSINLKTDQNSIQNTIILTNCTQVPTHHHHYNNPTWLPLVSCLWNNFSARAMWKARWGYDSRACAREKK